MTNEERFKTPEERYKAHMAFCRRYDKCRDCPIYPPLSKNENMNCFLYWLPLEAEDDLLPCPFCGSKAEVVETHPVSSKSVFVRCQECGAFVTAFSTRDEAVAAWNRRAK